MSDVLFVYICQQLWFRTRREKWLQRVTDAITLAKDALTEHSSNNLN